MTNEEVRSNPELVARIRGMMESEPFQIVLEAMESEAPVNSPIPRGLQPHDAHILSGEQGGWAQYQIRMLSLKTRLPIPQTTPPADYRPEPEES